MGRKLFCEYGALAYSISLFKEARKKDLKDLIAGRSFAKEKDLKNLEYIWKGDSKVLLRKLHGVDMRLQKNKVVNLQIAGRKIDGIIVKPGEEFSFWNLVGNATKRKGYLEGLMISNGRLLSGTGGGLCQMANMIHWLVLHTPLTVTELHHHSDALFPDVKRRVPFGTGTSVAYKAVDYRFKNTTGYPVQIRVWLDSTFLYGEIRSTVELPDKYRLVEEDNHYAREPDGIFYRNSKVYRIIIDKETKEQRAKELILNNHSRVMYDYDLIPEDEIREYSDVRQDTE
ncbi:MAG: VanW family protein [Lachnospiraceae bacterium]|nr:VanW family protein [Lachnospiraceae bacterium]